MSYEIQTRIKPDLPRGDWTVLLRLAGVGDTPISPLASELLKDLVPRDVPGALASRWLITRDEDNGKIYARFDGRKGEEGLPVLAESVALLLGGTSILDLDVEIDARIEATIEINPNRALPVTFGYLRQDVTLEAREFQDSREAARFELDTSDLEDLQDH